MEEPNVPQEDQQTLYNPLHERDGCGVGFVADVAGRRSHRLLRQTLTAAANVEHRGALSADGRTGDGCGILTQVPDRLLRREVERQGKAAPGPGRLGVGMIFLPRDDRDAAARAEAIAREEIHRAGARVLMWRTVPTEPSALGHTAGRSRPLVRQIVIERPESMGEDEGERALYVARRRAQKRAIAAGCEPFHFCSLSFRTVVYKGLIVPSLLDRFYTDLRDPDYETAIGVFHQRFSTNTFPTWFLAQPFRFLAHNGEINTLRGNLNWLRAREQSLRSEVLGDELADVFPVVSERDSDSASLDRMFELLVMGGRSPMRALAMLLPEPHEHMPDMDPRVRAMFEYHAALMEPWDGPAAVIVSDGRIAGAALDRNGLRPLRYWITDDGLVVCGSEAGILPDVAPRVVEKGKLGPGQLLMVDTVAGRVVGNEEIKLGLGASRAFREWIGENLVEASARAPGPGAGPDRVRGLDDPALVREQLAFGYGREDIDRILEPMGREGKPPLGSMGDDTPLAVLSEKPQWIWRYFRQRFAQVTNPPIDPIRERLITSLQTLVGARGNLLEDSPASARLVRFESPVVTRAQLEWILSGADGALRPVEIDLRFSTGAGPEGLGPALERVCREAEEAVVNGATVLILSDRGVDSGHAPIPSLLATAAIHQRLIHAGKRLGASIVCDCGDAREDHHFACLLGYGAELVHPRVALDTIDAIACADEAIEGEAAFVRAVEAGILKVMSKMGISGVSSYRGAQLFEALGVSREIVDRFFTGTDSPVSGVGLVHLATDVLRFHAGAFGGERRLAEGGEYRYRRGGEHHAFNPPVFTQLHLAVRTGSDEAFEKYARLADDHAPCNLRDLLRWTPAGEALPIEEVEPVESIAARFCTQAMSHGALSREAHEVMSVAMNRIGAKSNSGEGGESADRFRPYADEERRHFHSEWRPGPGDHGNSAIKQVASGRFGVTPRYLASAREIEIKMAQGAKPGEGGQIPGFKVSEEIAELRRASPGTTLISPPPHHDIYSIEDLEQLIYDLKRVNREARICVKLVALAGIGPIAAGVAKAYADCIQISGHDGGTGASPIGSIRHAGLPWELGLGETQQVLVRNGLRGRVRLRVDGGLRTGRDVVIAAMLGAEEFGFGTSALIAAGCVMARQCHSNTCPVGIATQRPELRAKFPGRPEHVVSFMMFVAQHVRMILASLGVRSIDEIVGRCELLRVRTDVDVIRLRGLDLHPLIADPAPGDDRPRRCNVQRNDRPEPIEPLDERVFRACWSSVERGAPVVRDFAIDNRCRSVGARLAGEIARHMSGSGPAPESVRLVFRGVAGQSFGAFCTSGMSLRLEGEAQDYVAKGMDGGRIVIVPPASPVALAARTNENTIIGNTVLYGATGGALFAAGAAGERFGVRNSGAIGVVEGCGNHGCEYMTGGTVVILGRTGRNFGAGMTGGSAYVLDLHDYLERHYNTETVALERVDFHEQRELRELIEAHVHHTGSAHAASVLERWEMLVGAFWRVTPRSVIEARVSRSA